MTDTYPKLPVRLADYGVGERIEAMALIIAKAQRHDLVIKTEGDYRAAKRILAEVIAPMEQETDAHVAALEQKIGSLCKRDTCGCSYDRPEDVCMYHSPALTAAKARIAELEEALQPFAGYPSDLPGETLVTFEFSIADFRRVRRALAGRADEEGTK